MANCQENHKNSENSANSAGAENEEEDSQEFNGWLMKRTRLAHKWEKKWFSVRRGEIVYGSNEGVVEKHIPLQGAQIAESSPDKKKHAFKIKPKNSKRAYYVHSETEDQKSDWMQAICFAKAAGGRTDQSEACIVQ